MAVFPENNIQMSYVAVRLGYGYFTSKTTIAQRVRLSTLCTCPRINTCSRRRPGYWKESGMELVFQKPRGGSYADPRGVRNNQAKTSTEDYVLNDFAGYNPEAITPGFEGGNREIHNGSGDNEVNMDLRFYLGEVDWFNEETDYNGRNFFGRTYTHLHVVLIQGDTRTIMTSGNKFEFTYKAALGTSDHAYAYFPDTINGKQSGKVTITVTRSEQLFYVITSVANAALEDAISGPSGDLVSPAFYGNTGNIVGSNDYVDVKGFRVELNYSDGKRYIVTTMRWKVGGELRLVNSAGSTVRTARLDNVTMAYYGDSGSGENRFYCFRLDFSALKLGASRDGYRIQWFLDTFDPATAVEYNP